VALNAGVVVPIGIGGSGDAGAAPRRGHGGAQRPRPPRSDHHELVDVAGWVRFRRASPCTSQARSRGRVVEPGRVTRSTQSSSGRLATPISIG
jgi:hypothetical protein